ncbi:MAG: SRPBCC domain-containing protein [Aquabacterium sp.]|nr:SRPBCC domain-containing protein [Aquabacterium sp.]
MGSGALQRLHLPGSSGLWTLAGPVLVGGLVLATPPTAAAERAIDKEVVVPAPVGEVWAAWTTREGIRSFFAPDAEVDAKVGGAFHIHMDPLAPPGAKGADDMRFMALQPMRMLSFDWNAPPSLAQVRQQRTFVVVRLEPIDERQTRVRLHHTGWGDEGQWDQAYAYFDRAWGNVLANLRKRFESGPVDWTAWMNQLRRMHGQAESAPQQR